MRDACNNIIQCIVDECAMCLEPETLVPIHWSSAYQLVQNRPCMTYSSSKAGTTSIMADRFKLNNFLSNVKGRGNILGTIFFMHSFKAYGGSATTDIGNCYEILTRR